MSITLERILAATPASERGLPTQLSADKKGERIAYASGKSIFVRSIDNPADCKQYVGHTAATTVARFSPSGFYIASGDVSGKVRVWDSIGAENTKGEYSIISGRINDIAWDSDSQRLIAVGDGRERFGHCITADSGNSIGEVIGHSKPINSVSIRQQRPLRAATVSDDGSLCFMHGAPFKFNSKVDNLHKGFVFATRFSPDGEKLVSVGADKLIQVYDGKTGEYVKTFGEGGHTGSVFALAWAEDSKRIVTASADQSVRLWDVEAGTQIKAWQLGPEKAHQVGVVLPHGRTDGLIISLNSNGDLTYLYADKDAPVKVVQGHNKSVTGISAGSFAGSSAWTGSFEGRVCAWDLKTGEAKVVEGAGHTNQVAGFSATGGKTMSIGWDDTLRSIDEGAGSFGTTVAKLAGQPAGVAITEDGTTYVALASEAVVVYKDGQLVGEQKLSFTPSAIAAFGKTVVVSGEGNKVNVYSASGSSLAKETELTRSTSPVSVLSFSKDGFLLATGNSAGKIIVYKVGSDWPVATDRWSAHTARVVSIMWNETGSHAVSGSLDTNVFLWSLEKPGARVKVEKAHKDGVHGVAWVEGGKKVISTGADATVKVWEIKI